MPPDSVPVRDADPETAWAALRAAGDDPDGRADGGAILIDVRTQAEWSFVGLPDLSATGRAPALIEWQSFPDMAVNPAFAAAALDAIAACGAREAYFLCRSGVRSLHAAHAVAKATAATGRAVACVNVAGGFEGDPDADGRRGALNGWKASGLPWRQS